MNYANRKQIPFVILAGDSEMEAKKFTLKNMETGEQQLVDAVELPKILKNNLYRFLISSTFFRI